jgi:hypothetical protein
MNGYNISYELNCTYYNTTNGNISACNNIVVDMTYPKTYSYIIEFVTSNK